MNSTSLKAKINNKAQKNNLMPQDLLQMYFFERLLYRISISKYKNNFILKGGLLLSAIFGDERRTTQDMDTMIKGIDINNDNFYKIVEEIIKQPTDDGINFEILKTKNIRVEDKYGGTRLSLVGKKEELLVNLKIDITTKDPIIPRELEFKYKSMFNDKDIKIMVFTKESIIAEKFETLIEDVENNTRAKDYYDIYMLMNAKIDYDNLKKAIYKTFDRRNKTYLLEQLNERFAVIKSSNILRLNWINYQKNHIYACDIEFDELLYKVIEIINVLTKELVTE